VVELRKLPLGRMGQLDANSDVRFVNTNNSVNFSLRFDSHNNSRLKIRLETSPVSISQMTVEFKAEQTVPEQPYSLLRPHLYVDTHHCARRASRVAALTSLITEGYRLSQVVSRKCPRDRCGRLTSSTFEPKLLAVPRVFQTES